MQLLLICIFDKTEKVQIGVKKCTVSEHKCYFETVLITAQNIITENLEMLGCVCSLNKVNWTSAVQYAYDTDYFLADC